MDHIAICARINERIDQDLLTSGLVEYFYCNKRSVVITSARSELGGIIIFLPLYSLHESETVLDIRTQYMHVYIVVFLFSQAISKLDEICAIVNKTTAIFCQSHPLFFVFLSNDFCEVGVYPHAEDCTILPI